MVSEHTSYVSEHILWYDKEEISALQKSTRVVTDICMVCYMSPQPKLINQIISGYPSEVKY